ncbi:MAG: bacillithiol biosynthesis cysteine-adding enzyme BshC [Calditrichaeota bacterium]|nr:bacillithiol biosynthesis cysteine-adding enzyme BshC [Calditrichota bacterium]RQW03182.1 MAG: bacillithiol biosynthesis cysteine-adding enzyme BshC [Calditrichota bacterium]
MTFNTEIISVEEEPDLFSAYIYQFQRVKSLFSWDPSGNLNGALQARINAYSARPEMIQILKNQNSSYKLSESTIHNLEKLSQDNCLAVVTGQQAGLFSGPLYTIYKILTVIKLCSKLESEYSDFSFVPLFWMEVGDSDYREINHIHILDAANQLRRLKLPDTPEDFRSVYLRDLPAEINDIHKELREIFVPNDFRDNILNRVEEIFAPGKKIPQAFAEWIYELLGEFGVIVLNPTDPEFSSMARPVFKSALEGQSTIQHEFEQVNQELENGGFHSQIRMENNQTLLFYRGDNNARLRVDVDPPGRNYILRSPEKSVKISCDELFRQLDAHPEKFTPNVALRPLIQDWLLPTALYVGGPGEISYAAQLKPLYQLLKVAQPVFYPRVRLTLLEKKIQKALEKTGLNYQEIFRYRKKLVPFWIQHKSDQRVNHEIDSATFAIQNILDRLNQNVINIDPTLESAFEKTSEHIQDGINRLRERVTEAASRKMENEIRQVEKVSSNLFPEGIFQERMLNIVQYLVKYGPDFINELYKSLNVEQFDHQLIIF